MRHKHTGRPGASNNNPPQQPSHSVEEHPNGQTEHEERHRPVDTATHIQDLRPVRHAHRTVGAGARRAYSLRRTLRRRQNPQPPYTGLLLAEHASRLREDVQGMRRLQPSNGQEHTTATTSQVHPGANLAGRHHTDGPTRTGPFTQVRKKLVPARHHRHLLQAPDTPPDQRQESGGRRATTIQVLHGHGHPEANSNRQRRGIQQHPRDRNVQETRDPAPADSRLPPPNQRLGRGGEQDDPELHPKSAEHT